MWNESKASEDYWADDKLVDKYFVRDPDTEYVWCGICGQEFYFDNSSMIYHIPNKHPELTESKATETISEDEKDEIFQYLFDLQESGATNMFGSGAYVERDFPHLDKREVGDVITEWMANWDEIATRMGIESYATENPTSDGYSWSADQDEISRIQFQTNLTKEEKNREIQKIEKRQQEQEDLELEADTPRNRTGYFESKEGEKDVFADIEKYDNDGKTMTPKERWDWTEKRLQQLMAQKGESKETEHDDLSSGHQISDRYSNTYILFLQRWKQEHPDWKQNVDKTLSNFVKYMVKMGYNKRSAEMAWNDYLYSPESKSSEANISKVLREYGVDMEEAQRIADGIGVNVQGLVDSDNFYYYLQEYRAELSSIMRDADAEFANYTDKDYEKFGLRKNSKGDWYDPKKTSESKANEVKCKNCQGKGWYLGDLNPNVSNDYGEIECEYCNGTGKDPKFGDESKASEGKVKSYCNICGYDTWRNEGEDCPYHQRVLSDGTFLWDEFNQDGEGYDKYGNRHNETCPNCGNTEAPFLINDEFCNNCYVKPPESKWEKYDRYMSYGVSDADARSDIFTEAGLEDHSCPECGFITSDNSDYVDHLNAHEE